MSKKYTKNSSTHRVIEYLLTPLFYLLILLALSAIQCGPKRYVTPKKETTLIIGKIRFIDAKAIKEKELKKAMRIIAEGEPYNEYKVKAGLNNVISFYRSKGFFDTKVISEKGELSPQKNRINLIFTIEEGKRVVIKSIAFVGNEIISNKKLTGALFLRKGEPYNNLKIFTSKYNITSLYAQKGYIYTEITTSPEDSFIINNNLVFHIYEGKQVFVNDVRIKGDKKVRRRIIEREILLKPGDIYSPRNVYASQQKIYSTGLFDDVKSKILGVKEKKENVEVVFEVMEGKTRWITLGSAFQTPNRITVSGGWGHQNLFNNNQLLNLDYTYTFNFEKEEWGNLNINYTEPYLFSTPFKFSLYLFNDREVTLKESNGTHSTYFGNIYGMNSRIGYPINLTSSITNELKFKKAFINVIGDYQPTRDIVTNSILFAYSRDTRDNIFNPRKGLHTLTSIELAGSILRGDNHFLRYTQDISLYRHFTKRSVIATKFKIGYTVTLKGTPGDSISVDERFELGGANSLRGYGESSIGPIDIRGKHSGIYLINGGEELRFPLYKILGGAIFIDWGGIWLNKNNISLKGIKLGIGSGIRINTMIGPVRLDYGYRLTDRTEKYKGNIYFAIGNAF